MIRPKSQNKNQNASRVYAVNCFCIITSRISITQIFYLCNVRQLYIESVASWGVCIRVKNSDSKGLFISRKKVEDPNAKKHHSL